MKMGHQQIAHRPANPARDRHPGRSGPLVGKSRIDQGPAVSVPAMPKVDGRAEKAGACVATARLGRPRQSCRWEEEEGGGTRRHGIQVTLPYGTGLKNPFALLCWRHSERSKGVSWNFRVSPSTMREASPSSGEAVRTFADRGNRTAGAAIDRDNRFPTDLWPKLGSMGLLGSPFPKRWAAPASAISPTSWRWKNFRARPRASPPTEPTQSVRQPDLPQR